ncbi:aldo/keto reductase [Candidatus Woesearchaeota archaeon]|nr:aldo/keto reductase [Candidatus Woesearchaeota archaeon]
MPHNYPSKRIAVIIQARVGSTRLPSKILLNLAGKPMLTHIIERCQTLLDNGDIDAIVVATSTNVKIAQECGVQWYQGSEDDIMQRYKEAAQKYAADIIIRVTADCPLVDVEEISRMLAYFMEHQTHNSDKFLKLDYIHNISNTGLTLNNTGVPLGLGAEIITKEALLKADALAVKPYQREPFLVIEEFPQQFSTEFFPASPWLQHHTFRLTVDEQADYDLMNIIYDKLYHPLARSARERIVTIKECIDFLKSHPDIAAINSNVNQKTYYAVSEYLQAPNVVFYCEASSDIGLGHVMRSLTLAQKLKDKYNANVCFYVNLFEPALNLISKANFVYSTSPNIPNTDIIVIDVLRSLILGEQLIRRIKNKCKALVIIDDLYNFTDLYSSADIVVNTQISADETNYDQFPALKKLLGLNYLLLRRSFQKYLNEISENLKKKQQSNLKNILVTFGGGDRLGSTLKVITALNKASLPIKITVIIGNAFPFMKELEQLRTKLSSNFEIVFNASNIEDYMYQADIAFCTAGYTGYELLALGTPFFVIEQEPEQQRIIEKLVETGAVRSLGYHDKVTEEKIITAVTSLLLFPQQLVDMKKKCYGLIDGKGTERVADEIIKIYKQKNSLNISKITLGTAQFSPGYGVANTRGNLCLKEAYSILQTATALGITVIDTAPIYGEAEKRLGSFFSKLHQKELPTIVTKISDLEQIHTLEQEQAYEFMKSQVLSSARKLQLSKISICLLHDASNMNNPKVISSLLRLKEEGLVGKIGVSIYHPDEVTTFLNTDIFEVIQLPINLLDTRLIKNGLLHKLHQKRILVFARSIFLQGLFFLDYKKLPPHLEFARDHLKRIHQIAHKIGLSVPQLAFTFVRDIPEITSLVIGAENAQQIEETVSLLQTEPLPEKINKEILNTFNNVPEKLINPSLWESKT